jgi:hypothetical protein
MKTWFKNLKGWEQLDLFHTFAGDYALTAFVLTLVATAVAHLMALVTPRPRMFFSWIVGLATVAGMVLALAVGETTESQVATASINLALGVCVLSLLGSVMARTVVRTGPSLSSCLLDEESVASGAPLHPAQVSHEPPAEATLATCTVDDCTVSGPARHHALPHVALVAPVLVPGGCGGNEDSAGRSDLCALRRDRRDRRGLQRTGRHRAQCR